MSQPCFHCSLPVPDGQAFPVHYRQRTEQACCAGCQAVAQTIIDSGLGDYYQHRTEHQGKAEALPAELLEQIRLYDSEALQQSFVHSESGDIREAALMLEGITCAACIWLNEQHVRKLPGVLSVDINYATHRARVRWDNRQLPLSRILEAIAAIGYRAHPYDASRQEALHQKERKQALNRLWVAGLSMMQVMMYAVPVYMAPDGEIESQWLWLLHWSSFVLTLPVVVYSAIPFYTATWRDLKLRRVGMDTPVTIGILTAFFASLWALINRVEHGVYFDSVSMFIFLLLGGRYLESMARRKTGEATERLVKLIPAFAHRISAWPSDRQSHEVPVSQLQSGDTLLVKPGETFPCDGTLLEGQTSVDESLLTGESVPIAKQTGSHIVAGSVNQASPVYLSVTRAGNQTRLAAIVRLLDQAQADKPKLAELADRFAAWFVTLLLLVAAGTYLGWMLVDSHEHALWITVAVLVVSCPCALSLATPAALTAAAGHLAQIGVLTTRGHALETLAKITDAVFDKTGTLTHGRMAVLATHATGMTTAEVLGIAAALEQGSEHPIAEAILRAAENLPRLTATELHNQPGTGVSGLINGHRWQLGKPGTHTPPAELPGHATLITLSDPDGIRAWLALGDTPREQAPLLITALQQQGIRVHLLSGDGEAAVAGLAANLGIAAWQAGASPEAKLAYVRQLQSQSRRVLMVGDGVNDAPVLAQADVSLAMGSGTDVARASGDMVLMGDDIGQLSPALALSRRTLRIIRQNLSWAAVYNLVALPLAIAGHITPWLASLGMALSSLLVVSNALRLIKRSR